MLQTKCLSSELVKPIEHYENTNFYRLRKNIIFNEEEEQYEFDEVFFSTSAEVKEEEFEFFWGYGVRWNANIENEIQDELHKYDYIGTKIAMGVATREDYKEQIEYTELLRKYIRII